MIYIICDNSGFSGWAWPVPNQVNSDRRSRWLGLRRLQRCAIGACEIGSSCKSRIKTCELWHREAVDGFDAQTLSKGRSMRDHPRIRGNYDPAHHAAFVRDPDGYLLEAVLT